MKKERHPLQSVDNKGIVPTWCAMSNPVGRLLTTVLVLFAFFVAGQSVAQAQLSAQPTRLTVQDGASGIVTNTLSFTVDTNMTLNLSVDISAADGVSSAVLNQSTFTAPVDDELVTNAVLTVTYNGTVPQAGTNEIVITASNDFDYRLPIPTHSTYIWDGATNDTAWSGNWLPSDPGSTDNVLFTSVGAADFGTNFYTNVVVSSSTEVAGLRFSHGEEANDNNYAVEIQPGVTLSVTGTEGFTMLRDTVIIDQADYEEMYVEFFGGGNLVVSNSAANWSMLAEAAEEDFVVLNMEGLKSFTADVDRVGLGSYEVYPNWETNGYSTEPDQWVPNVMLAETNFIRTAWIGGEDVVTNKENRPYAFTLGKMHSGGTSSGQQFSLILGRTNAFFVESILIGGGGAKGDNDDEDRVIFNPDTNVIPTSVVPVAYFRGSNDSSRISVFAIADASGPGGSGSSAKGNVNLRDGKVDALIDRLYVGRDRWESTDNAVGQGKLSIGGDNAAGTIIDVNTAYIAAQETGTNATTELDDDPSGEVFGTVDVDVNATLKVNGTLHLGYSTEPAGGVRKVETGYARLNVNGGTVVASNIFVGGPGLGTVDNTISVAQGGALIFTNTIGQTNKSLKTLTLNDSKLTLHVDGNNTNAYIFTDDLITGGLSNLIEIASVANIGSYPATVTLIKYDKPASPNFTVTLPSGTYGYIINNTVNKTVDVRITDQAPHDLVWDGGSGTVWDEGGAANWVGGQYFTNGDSATFNDDANGTTVSLSGTVFAGGAGVIVSNDTLAFTFTGGGALSGTSPMNKWGSNSMTMNAASALPLTIHEGSVIGGGTLGSTEVWTNTSLTFSGEVGRVVSSGATFLEADSSVANGADVLAGTLTNLGNIIGSTFNVFGDAVMVVPTDGTVSMTLGPGTCTVEDGGLLQLDGTLVSATLSSPDGEYRLDIFGQLIGTGQILAASPYLLYTEPTLNSRLVIGNGGLLSPGVAADDIVTFTNTGRFDFSQGSRVIIDVDMDSADGSNPWSGQSGGGNIWTTAKNSDTLYLSRWNTTEGVLEMNNVGTTPFTNGVVLKVFKKKFDQYYVAPPSTSAKFGNISNNPKLPVMDPGRPDVGLLWDLSNFKTNGVIRVVADTLPTNTVPLVTTWTSTNLTLSWPASHTGWELETQTNALSVGLSTNWGLVDGSTDTNQMSFPINEDDETRFYQLAYPSYGVTTNAP